MRLIIHFKEGQDKELLVGRLASLLPRYYRLKPPEDDRRLTVRVLDDGALAIYHDQKDLVIFGRASTNE